MSKDLAIGPDGDLVIENMDLKLVDDTQALIQRIRRMLLCIKGESFYDEEVGTEYYPYIAEKDIEPLKKVIADSIRNVKGVKDLVTFNAEIINNTRTLKLNFEVTDNLGNTVSLSEAIQVGI
ncbi:hypothetical protein Trichorick_01373 (plasmid) [Candidatus Trichorickettsia mobilis]|uniref:DUF2634 domain-containing protein n=1 Tax=Candidatus Trichorickettsia mobilis TaxID=1346319 RepID=A0ABZ0UTU3_9RICK|nr:hypothetical protein [Candidatus Trichorickettsia mobilis]WPY01460.1 hypothetical protein Trichorick_01373 [Candidatus Trichorickettsia mobilis]